MGVQLTNEIIVERGCSTSKQNDFITQKNLLLTN